MLSFCPPLRVPVESLEIRRHLNDVLNYWGDLSEDLLECLLRILGNYMAIESNELEGGFKLTQQVCIEPPSLDWPSGC